MALACEQIRTEFSALLDDELDMEDRELVEEHLSECADCLRELHGFKQVSDAYRYHHPVKAPADFEERLREAMAPPAHRFGRLGMSTRYAAAAVLVVGVGLAIWRVSVDKSESFQTSMVREKVESDLIAEVKMSVVADEAAEATEMAAESPASPSVLFESRVKDDDGATLGKKLNLNGPDVLLEEGISEDESAPAVAGDAMNLRQTGEIDNVARKQGPDGETLFVAPASDGALPRGLRAEPDRDGDGVLSTESMPERSVAPSSLPAPPPTDRAENVESATDRAMDIGNEARNERVGGSGGGGGFGGGGLGGGAIPDPKMARRSAAAPPQSPAPSEDVAAVDAKEKMVPAEDQDSAPSSDAAAAPKSEGLDVAPLLWRDRNFVLEKGTRQQSDYAGEGLMEVAIPSEAWTKLLDRFPDLVKLVDGTEKVVVELDATWYRITPSKE